MDNEQIYHGIIIEESLRDRTILDKINILGNKKIDAWTLLKVSIESKELQNFVNVIQQSLIEDDDGIPYYVHFYRENLLIIVFPLKMFHVTTNVDTWDDVIKYGKSLGIPESQLDFFPNTFADETF